MGMLQHLSHCESCAMLVAETIAVMRWREVKNRSTDMRCRCRLFLFVVTVWAETAMPDHQQTPDLDKLPEAAA